LLKEGDGDSENLFPLGSRGTVLPSLLPLRAKTDPNSRNQGATRWIISLKYVDHFIAVVAMKRRNPTWGCPRIAQQITLAFGVDIDKDVVRRILGKHYGLESGSDGPSWLTFLGQARDSLWSIDLFRCESLSLRKHWMLVVMDQFTRRIIGFGIHRGTVDGPSLCSMFQRAIQGKRCRSISARTTIRCIGSTNGRPTFECWR
jgi:hypothetical protein